MIYNPVPEDPTLWAHPQGRTPQFQARYIAGLEGPASLAELARVTERIAEALRAPAHGAAVRSRGLEPLALTGAALQAEIDSQLDRMRQEAERFGLGPRR